MLEKKTCVCVFTLCVHVAFGVNARLTKAIVRCSDEVAVKRDALRAPVGELIPLAVDELIESQMFSI